jgi:hypothetical protein
VGKKDGGQAIAATAVDIGSSGMRLITGQPCSLDIEDEVSVEIELPELPDKPFSTWGIGRVAYKNERGIGIQLHGGKFLPLPCGEPVDDK